MNTFNLKLPQRMNCLNLEHLINVYKKQGLLPISLYVRQEYKQRDFLEYFKDDMGLLQLLFNIIRKMLSHEPSYKKNNDLVQKIPLSLILTQLSGIEIVNNRSYCPICCEPEMPILIDTDKNFLVCSSCDFRGGPIELIQKIYHYSKCEAVENLSNFLNN